MPRNFSRKTYDRWIENNLHRFKYKPYLQKNRKSAFEIRFYGLSHQILFRMDKFGQATVQVNNTSDEYWDILQVYDVCEFRTEDGRYCCEGCEQPVYYATRASLWEAHILEELLSWINQISEDDWIGLYGSETEGFGAYRFQQKDFTEAVKVKNLHGCFSIVSSCIAAT